MHTDSQPTDGRVSSSGQQHVTVALRSINNDQSSEECSYEDKVDVTTSVAIPTPTLMSYRRRLANILGLSLGWCLMVSVIFIQLSTSTQAARDFSSSATATLPAGIMMAAATFTAVPGTLAMQRYGRRLVLFSTALAAAGGGALMCAAAKLRAMWLLVVGSIPLGVCFAQSNNLRFAATEFAEAGGEARALSLVVTGAMLSAVVGPELARYTRAAIEPLYVATYVLVTGLCLLYAVLMVVIEFHRTAELVKEKAAVAAGGEGGGSGGSKGEAAAAVGKAGGGSGGSFTGGQVTAAGKRAEEGKQAVTGPEAEGVDPLASPVPAASTGPTASAPSTASSPPVSPRHAAALPPPPAPPAPPGGLRRVCWSVAYLVPVVTAGLTYGGMAAMMSATPLAIADAGFTFDDTTQVIQVHILCMFVPSLFTGDVVRLLGAAVTMTAGAVVLLGGTAVFYAGLKSLPVFFGANGMVGVGWNWAYVGASALVAARLAPLPGAQKFAVQGLMDTVVLALTGLSVSLTGTLYSWLGWPLYIAVFLGVNGISVVMDGAMLMSQLVQKARARRGGQLGPLPATAKMRGLEAGTGTAGQAGGRGADAA